MSEIKTITIPTTQLPTRHIAYGEHKIYGIRGKSTGWHDNGLHERCQSTDIVLTTMSETQIHENVAQALKELHRAQRELQWAEERVESLRMFARELYASPSLKVVNE